MTIHQFVSGMVEQRTAKGILVDKSWCTLSKFNPVDLPPLGSQVKVGVDNKDFIVSIEVLSVGGRPLPSGAASSPHADRLEVLRLAAAFGASRPECKSGDVLQIADSWLAWLEDHS